METSVSNNPDDHSSFSNMSNLPATSVTYDFFRTELLQEAPAKHLQFFFSVSLPGFYLPSLHLASRIFSSEPCHLFFFLLYILLQIDWAQFIFNLTCSCSKQQGMTFKYKILCYITSLLNCLHFKFRNCNGPNATITSALAEQLRAEFGPVSSFLITIMVTKPNVMNALTVNEKRHCKVKWQVDAFAHYILNNPSS